MRIADRSITLERFLDITDEDDDFELVKGALIPKMSAQYPHESRFAWLFSILRMYVQAKNLGVILGSRSAVEINQFGGRLPDILFVSKSREHIIQNRALFGAPDMVIEIVSPSNTRSDLVELEVDYMSIGVAEIIFWHADDRKLVVLRKHGEEYSRETLTSGEFRPETIPGFHLSVNDMFLDPLPNEVDLL